MVEAAAKLLDFNQPIDVPLLEATVELMYGAANGDQRVAAERLLLQFQEHPLAWQRVDVILGQAKNESTKYFALQILENVIRYKWGALPVDQREGIKTFLSNIIIRFTTDEALFRKENTFVNKLNIILVQILKHDWPSKWKTFIPDIVSASKTSETLCENSMKIFKLLSEEVFDFARLDLTQAKTKELKTSLNSEFRLIHELCVFVLCNTRKPDLIRATLDTLAVYLTWVPLGYIFESNLLQILLQLFPQPNFRNVALQCLTEVGMLVMGPEFNSQFETFYKIFMQQLAAVVPPTVNIPEAYERGTDDQQKFVQNLALFFTGFFKGHISLLESTPENQQALLLGLDYLVNISYVDNVEVFKTCLDYWNYFVPDVYTSSCTMDPTTVFSFSPMTPPQPPKRKVLYGGILQKLRQLMICRMAKPEEVIVVEDENGNIVRETMKDNDVLAQYKTMRETLVYLCHLDYEDTEAQMLEKLRMQLQTTKWAWQVLNTLCWAIGSISGSMQEEQENRFLVTVIRDLLNLCEITRGKDNKAVIASNIMYVVGQYPKFLRAHWKFLKTVVNKLFEFMHETHPGVQDMACDTFLKICSKCRRKFVILQLSEREPFISELLTNLADTIHDLQPHQVHTFYEAVGLMIGAESEAAKRDEYLARLMGPPNATWQQILAQARTAPDILKQQEVIKSIQNVLQTNVSVCTSLGQPFVAQFNVVFPDMLQVYKLYSELISQTIAEGGPYAARSTFVKYMRSVKKVTLKLIECFSEKAEDPALIATTYVPAMLDPILGDYARAVPDARDAEVLSLWAAIINKLRNLMEETVPRVFEAVFEVTLQMITRNFEDYPEHRLQFFALLHAIVNHCFRTLLHFNPTQLKLIIDSIVWAFRHTERNVAETGLNLLQDLLAQFSACDLATQFYQTYYLQLIQEIFAVMTDSFHKPGFKLHAHILHHLFNVLDTNAIKAPLWDVAAKGPAAYPSNSAFVREHVAALLTSSFPNLTPAQVAACVAGMFELRDFTGFKHHLRDFLVQTKQFASTDNAELFAEEVEKEVKEAKAVELQRLAAVPGLVPQAELLPPEDMADA
uniref:Importin N-terminal domain-containing protein n=1 Tax=Chlamydomonas leiostraca TaxID=1034604 RepID=A0A7S0WF70_9CHLO|mmetsp:Transcript_12263/g.29917  ORF Transcript_12263/g.29917 Transcript_12263/m.29917 type:complete len:1073 (+) Transcript_12263:129-3347(+)